VRIGARANALTLLVAWQGVSPFCITSQTVILLTCNELFATLAGDGGALPSRWVTSGDARLAHFYHAFRMAFLRRCNHQILGPRRHFPELADGLRRHCNASSISLGLSQRAGSKRFFIVVAFFGGYPLCNWLPAHKTNMVGPSTAIREAPDQVGIRGHKADFSRQSIR
jgi:hypothetical protein